MNRFRFQLDPLLELRKQKEESVKLELAEKNRQIMEGRQQMLSLYEQLKGLQARELEDRRQGADLLQMRASVAYRFKLKLDMLTKGREIETLSQQAGNIRRRLTEAVRDRRAIELLREERLRQWRRRAAREEQGFIDDISQQAFVRNREAVERSGEE